MRDEETRLEDQIERGLLELLACLTEVIMHRMLFAGQVSSNRITSCAVLAISVFSSSAWNSASNHLRSSLAFSALSGSRLFSSATMSTDTFTVAQIPCLSDNYGKWYLSCRCISISESILC